MFNYKLKEFFRDFYQLLLVLLQFFIIFLHFIEWEFISREEIIQSNVIFNLISVFMIIGGLIIMLMAVKDLGSNFSPFPKPKPNSNLTTRGVYSLIRHPMYYSLIMLSFGIFINKLSIYYLVLTLSLIAIIKFKILLEEEYLNNKFSNYCVYKDKVKY